MIEQNEQPGQAAILSAAREGDSRAQFQLARFAMQAGREDEFRHWIQQSASQNFPPAMFRLGLWRLSQTVSPEEISDAKDLIRRSADLGFINAIRAMVVLNARGTGDLPNWQEALHWFKTSLHLNDPRSYREAGLLLQEIEPNIATGLLTHAAAAGDFIAAYHLGCRLRDGREDLRPEALYWLDQAQAGGHVLAARELARFKGEAAAAPDRPLPILEWPVVKRLVSALEEPITPYKSKSVLEDPRVRIAEDVLSGWECDYVIARAQPLLQPAATSESIEAGREESDYRTNSGAKFWTQQQDLIISMVDRKMALAAETPVDFAEDLVVLNYKEDERYYPHCDSFLPELSEQAAEIERKGQRIRTCLVYLNDEFEGGETHFLHPEKKIRCKAGTSLIFENVTEEGDVDEHSVHEGLPVSSGQKWLASKWIRDKSQVLF